MLFTIYDTSSDDIILQQEYDKPDYIMVTNSGDGTEDCWIETSSDSLHWLSELLETAAVEADRLAIEQENPFSVSKEEMIDILARTIAISDGCDTSYGEGVGVMYERNAKDVYNKIKKLVKL